MNFNFIPIFLFQFTVLSQTGPVHAPTFVVSFSINGQTFEGKGGNKKIAKLNVS